MAWMDFTQDLFLQELGNEHLVTRKKHSIVYFNLVSIAPVHSDGERHFFFVFWPLSNNSWLQCVNFIKEGCIWSEENNSGW